MKVIRKDIPLPGSKVRAGRKNANPFDAMEVGDSFLVENERLGAVRVSACRENKKSAKKYLVGQHESKRGMEWRCWRIA